MARNTGTGSRAAQRTDYGTTGRFLGAKRHGGRLPMDPAARALGLVIAWTTALLLTAAGLYAASHLAGTAYAALPLIPGGALTARLLYIALTPPRKDQQP